MGKIFLLLGLIGTVVSGVLLGGRLVSKDLTGTVEAKGTDHACPTLGVALDGDPKELPEAVTKCCASPPVSDGKWTLVHPDKETGDAAAPGDRLVVGYREFTPPFGGEKKWGLSFTLDRGGNKETRTVRPASPLYQSFALFTIAPLGIGIVLAVVAGLLFGKKSGAA